jgi:replicative DNA helicase
MSTAEEYLHSETDEFTLGCLLTAPSGRLFLADALERVAPEDFYDAHYGELWRAARIITARGDRISARALLAEKDTPASRSRIDATVGHPVQAARVPDAIAGVLEHAGLRRLVQAADRIQHAATTAAGYSEAYEVAAREIASLSGAQSAPEVMSWDQVSDQWWDTCGAEEDGALVPTPWQEVNEMLGGGMRAGRSYVVAGRPGSGKSILGLNIAAAAAEAGHPALLFSVEMGWKEIAGRVMASGARSEYSEFVSGSLSSDTDRRAREYYNSTRGMPLALVDKPNVTVEYIAATARTHKRTKGLSVMVVDYLQLLDVSDRSRTREQQVAHLSRSLKLLSRELDCVVVVACQLNRGSARENRKPTLAELRESGSIEQDADVVLLLHHELVNDCPTGLVDVIVAKNRTGRTGTLSLPWRGHQARIG